MRRGVSNRASLPFRQARYAGICFAVHLVVKYVYLIRSRSAPDQRYIGVTSNLEERLRTHNADGSPHTSKYTPWELVSYVCFTDDQRAIEFERYLKSGRGAPSPIDTCGSGFDAHASIRQQAAVVTLLRRTAASRPSRMRRALSFRADARASGR